MKKLQIDLDNVLREYINGPKPAGLIIAEAAKRVLAYDRDKCAELIAHVDLGVVVGIAWGWKHAGALEEVYFSDECGEG
jgi:hypothetical protein